MTTAYALKAPYLALLGLYKIINIYMKRENIKIKIKICVISGLVGFRWMEKYHPLLYLGPRVHLRICGPSPIV